MERAGAPHPPLRRPPRRGRHPSAHGAAAVEATASAVRGRTGACDSGRATRPVAPATPHKTAMLAPPRKTAGCKPQPQHTNDRLTQHTTDQPINRSSIGHALFMAEAKAPLALATAARRPSRAQILYKSLQPSTHHSILDFGTPEQVRQRVRQTAYPTADKATLHLPLPRQLPLPMRLTPDTPTHDTQESDHDEDN